MNEWNPDLVFAQRQDKMENENETREIRMPTEVVTRSRITYIEKQDITTINNYSKFVNCKHH